MSAKFLQSVKYFIYRYMLRKQYLIAYAKKYSSKLKFKIEDTVGRRIYKNGSYESDLSDFINNHIQFNEGDIALDIGANIGWYSLLLDKKMPEGCQIYAFEPDPLNYQLLTFNIQLNSANKIKAIQSALSNKNEIKKLYRYSNKNLGRHSLLDINKGDFVDVEALILDDFLKSNNVDINRVKFAKIDIEGYEYFALSGALQALESINCLISEFVPRYLEHGSVDPGLLINLLEDKGFKSNVFKDGVLSPISRDELLSGSSCDIVWLK
ncbi:MAG: FkbM family methyltransferase [Gammaproteobacteria bacterium]|nr:FkbM family methyltransferase [Gammaproteobacteria bacterium]